MALTMPSPDRFGLGWLLFLILADLPKSALALSFNLFQSYGPQSAALVRAEKAIQSLSYAHEFLALPLELLRSISDMVPSIFNRTLAAKQ